MSEQISSLLTLSCRFWNPQKRRSLTAAVLWLHLVTWSPSRLRNECGCWRRGAHSHSSVSAFVCTRRVGRPSCCQYWKYIHSYTMKANDLAGLSTGVNWWRHRENLRCFALILQLVFATHDCSIRKCNNMATYAQECLVWSCALFVFLFHIFICFPLTVHNEYWWL